MTPRNRSRSTPTAQRHPQPARFPRLTLERMEDRLVPAGGIPELHSNPGAPAAIYLDFDGHFEPAWLSHTNITTPAFNQDGDPTSFGEAEVAAIRTAWARAAEDFAPFNIDVTTVEPAVLAPGRPTADANGKALRVSVGGDGVWYKGGGYGGVGAYHSFTNATANVCFVFDTGNDSPAWWIGNTVSHEAGHSFGLYHQSLYDANGAEELEYSPGDRSTWAPLMGIGYVASQVMIWHNGPTTSASTLQDDMAVLAGTTNGFGYRADDHGNTAVTATPLTAAGATWGGSGVVGTNADVDYFSFTVAAADTYRIAAGGPADAANLNAVVELRNGAGQLLEAVNPATSVNAAIVRHLAPDSYTAAVRTSGVYGFVGSYAVGVDAPPAGVTVTPPSNLLTTGEDGRATWFTVVLDTQPLADVVIPIGSTDPGEGAVSAASLVFTPANWNVPQTVVVTGVADGVLDRDAAYAVVIGPATSSDAEYAGLDLADLALVNVDTGDTGFLYHAENVSDTIRRVRLDGSHGEPLVDLKSTFGGSEYAPYGIAVDPAGGKVYWVDVTADVIRRANLDGSGVETVLTLAAGASWGIALDPAAGKMYWTDAATKKIHRANLDGTAVEDLVINPMSPYGIALDVTAGKMYWTEITTGAAGFGTIRRASLDGTNVETLWTGVGPSGSSPIALDTATGKMYWADHYQDLIVRANLDGTNVEVVVDTGAIAPGSYVRSLALDVTAGKMYWQDWATTTVYRAELDGSMVASLATVTSSFGMAVVRPAPGASVTGHSGLVTTEGGAGTSFRVVLTARPTAVVTIPVSSGDPTEGTVSVTNLTFTPDNWNVPQTVAVSSVDDAATDGNVAYTIALGPATSADPAYHGLNPADAAVTNLDNDFNKFFVVDDASTNRTYRYGATVNGRSNSTLNSGNSAPRGVATTVAGDKVWVVDANKKVYVYSAAGTLLGSWTAGSLPKTAQVEGITVWGNDVWVVDSAGDRVYRYANAAGRTSGSQNAAGSFALHVNDKGPKDLVTDGTHIWVVDDQVLDKVYKYTVSGAYVGAWAIDPANASPTGITLDPANPRHLWIVDNSSDRVYQYDYALSRTSGSLTASTSYALAAGNTNPQGIADPPPPGQSGVTAGPAGSLPEGRASYSPLNLGDQGTGPSGVAIAPDTVPTWAAGPVAGRVWFADPIPLDGVGFLTPGNDGGTRRVDPQSGLRDGQESFGGWKYEGSEGTAELLSVGERPSLVGVYVDGPRMSVAPLGTDEVIDPRTARRRWW